MTCNVATVTINVEDANDNRPILPEYDFGKGHSLLTQLLATPYMCLSSGVNQSAVVDTVIGRVMVSN